MFVLYYALPIGLQAHITISENAKAIAATVSYPQVFRRV